MCRSVHEQGWYEKFGFAVEGTHRLFAFRNGE